MCAFVFAFCCSLTIFLFARLPSCLPACLSRTLFEILGSIEVLTNMLMGFASTAEDSATNSYLKNMVKAREDDAVVCREIVEEAGSKPLWINTLPETKGETPDFYTKPQTEEEKAKAAEGGGWFS
jgi:hypothetical protein